MFLHLQQKKGDYNYKYSRIAKKTGKRGSKNEKHKKSSFDRISVYS